MLRYTTWTPGLGELIFPIYLLIEIESMFGKPTKVIKNARSIQSNHRNKWLCVTQRLLTQKNNVKNNLSLTYDCYPNSKNNHKSNKTIQPNAILPLQIFAKHNFSNTPNTPTNDTNNNNAQTTMTQNQGFWDKLIAKHGPEKVYAPADYNRWKVVPYAVSTHLCLGNF